MCAHETAFTSGLAGLDHALRGLLPGDNIVWQVDAIDDYRALVAPFVKAGLASGRQLVYFRFAPHPPLVAAEPDVLVVSISPDSGFETFIAMIHQVLERVGRGALCIFDCLSELVADWCSDQMLGNFFLLACSFLYEMETVAYFALFRNRHSSQVLQPILETTQLFLDVYRYEGTRYVFPLKVHLRYSDTMNMLHVWEGEEFRPVTSSVLASSILTSVNWSGMEADSRSGCWDRAFAEGRALFDALARGEDLSNREDETFQRLCRMIFSRNPRIFELASRYLELGDLLEVRRRMIGSGLVGGKTAGMLLARRILQRHSPRFAELLETNDSFYVGSDVFFTFLVRNGVWWVRQKQRNPETFLEGAELARQRILTGQFTEQTVQQFRRMLDYFGQSPIIVRSSSLLEDNFGNSFAGKYQSVFCPNQGPGERRLENFLSAVRTVYASTMNEDALRYREEKGLLEQDEQMALLVMRVSGAVHGRYFYPHASGVGFSFNPYVWNEHIDPAAGVVRLVFGLGTRAVERSDDDYTRVVALNAPERRPEADFEEVCRYAQRRVDFLDLEANRVSSGHFLDVIAASPDVPVALFASRDGCSERERNVPPPWVLTFETLLGKTPFVDDMRGMLHVLHQAYGCPVDVEFTLNFLDETTYRIHVVQCRPLLVRGMDAAVPVPLEIPEEQRILAASEAVIGHSRLISIDRIVYVVPDAYGQLSVRERHEVAKLIGRLNQTISPKHAENVMLLGPGRWGSSSPFLGIPVAFADICRIAVLGEIVAMHEHLVPDVSLGTHFFNELIEMDMLYLALFPGRSSSYLDSRFFDSMPNRLLDNLPDAGLWSDTVKVVNAADISYGAGSIWLFAEALGQKVVCYRQD